MSAKKIAKPGQLRRRIHHAHHNPLQPARDTRMQRLQHGMRSLSERDHEHVAIRAEMIKVLGNAQYAALALHVPREGTRDAGFRERLLKDLSRGRAHLPRAVLGHAADYNEDSLPADASQIADYPVCPCPTCEWRLRIVP